MKKPANTSSASASVKKRPKKVSAAGRHRGRYVRTSRSALTRGKKKIEEGQILLAVGDADDGWLPVIYHGGVEFVKSVDVRRLPGSQ